MGTPKWKVYDNDGEYIAACKLPEDAAMIIAGNGREGMTIRHGHTLKVWTEGTEDQEAGESYDFVAQTCYERLNAHVAAVKAKNDRQRVTTPNVALIGRY